MTLWGASKCSIHVGTVFSSVLVLGSGNTGFHDKDFSLPSLLARCIALSRCLRTVDRPLPVVYAACWFLVLDSTVFSVLLLISLTDISFTNLVLYGKTYIVPQYNGAAAQTIRRQTDGLNSRWLLFYEWEIRNSLGEAQHSRLVYRPCCLAHQSSVVRKRTEIQKTYLVATVPNRRTSPKTYYMDKCNYC